MSMRLCLRWNSTSCDLQSRDRSSPNSAETTCRECGRAQNTRPMLRTDTDRLPPSEVFPLNPSVAHVCSHAQLRQYQISLSNRKIRRSDSIRKSLISSE